VSLPEGTTIEKALKYSELYTLNRDFVSTAKTYARTIISEFFLHVKDKSIVARSMGGIAGGQVHPSFILHRSVNPPPRLTISLNIIEIFVERNIV
jgi:hypothetical protein